MDRPADPPLRGPQPSRRSAALISIGSWQSGLLHSQSTISWPAAQSPSRLWIWSLGWRLSLRQSAGAAHSDIADHEVVIELAFVLSLLCGVRSPATIPVV